ncbi:ABC transporter ATP-binding protein [uncultured Treponema sp.]|uniref:ABC transporter ATP-binding protein n=1 Tax=uncultured Treponema sp. TaxID=162155 RepID=UPI00280A5DE8|nr:ABC transporter ATP-binding protein [uncultured Treponema sp.]
MNEKNTVSQARLPENLENASTNEVLTMVVNCASSPVSDTLSDKVSCAVSDKISDKVSCPVSDKISDTVSDKVSDTVLEIKSLTKKFSLESGFFARKDRFVYALNNVSFEIERGKTYGLVGESGCGKSTTAKILAGMYRPDSGKIIFNGKILSCGTGGTVGTGGSEGSEDSIGSASCTSADFSKIKYIFQDPARSLNPRMTVFSILTDGLKHSKKGIKKEELRTLAGQIMEEVGLDRADLDRRPSEFSGGQRQRISIARGLLMEPELLICDEVVSALDVSIQGQILNLLQDIRSKRNLTILFIAHDLRVSCYFCDRIGVMYRGVLVEEGRASDFYKTAMHPYSKLLFAGSEGGKEASKAEGEVKTSLSGVSCCPFAHRCPKKTEKCLEKLPDWTTLEAGHKVRCFCL